MRCLLLVAFGLFSFVQGCKCFPDTPDERPPEICQPGADLSQTPFVDVTAELSLDSAGLNALGSVVATADIDGDRWPDLYLSKGQRGARDNPDHPSFGNRLLRNNRGKSFEDVTYSSGFTTSRDGTQGRLGQFALFADFDNDGDIDAFSGDFFGVDTTDTGDRSEVLLNNGDGTFALGPENTFSDHPQYDAVVAATSLDYDRDGVIDLFVGHHYNRYGDIGNCGQDALYRGLGAGSFTDKTQQAGLQTVASSDPTILQQGTNHRPTWGATACDINDDGLSDLLVNSYGRQFNLLWQANQDGSFTNVGRQVEFASDANRDYLDNEFYKCHCHAFSGNCNPMPPTPLLQCNSDNWRPGFDDQDFRLGGNSALSLCGDMDNDGDLDVLQVELRHWHIGESSDATEILYNDGIGGGGSFSRPGNAVSGLTRNHAQNWNEGDLGAALFDFDNDGRLDVLVTSSDYPDTHSLLWHQQKDKSFTNLTETSGLLQHRAHGISLLDYDRDGDYDVVLGTSLMRWSANDTPPPPPGPEIHLYRNQIGQDGNRLILDVRGKGEGHSNTNAIGAKITIEAGNDIFVREIQGGHGLSGQQNDSLEIIGLGEHCTVDTLEIRWPDAQGSVDSHHGIRANYVVLLRQGGSLTYQTLKKYTAQ